MSSPLHHRLTIAVSLGLLTTEELSGILSALSGFGVAVKDARKGRPIHLAKGCPHTRNALRVLGAVKAGVRAAERN